MEVSTSEPCKFAPIKSFPSEWDVCCLCTLSGTHRFRVRREAEDLEGVGVKKFRLFTSRILIPKKNLNFGSALKGKIVRHSTTVDDNTILLLRNHQSPYQYNTQQTQQVWTSVYTLAGIPNSTTVYVPGYPDNRISRSQMISGCGYNSFPG